MSTSATSHAPAARSERKGEGAGDEPSPKPPFVSSVAALLPPPRPPEQPPSTPSLRLTANRSTPAATRAPDVRPTETQKTTSSIRISLRHSTTVGCGIPRPPVSASGAQAWARATASGTRSSTQGTKTKREKRAKVASLAARSGARRRPWEWLGFGLFFRGQGRVFFECKIEGRAPLKMAMSSPDTGRRFVSLFLPSYLNTQGQRRGQGKHAPTAQQTPRDSYEVPHGNSRWPLHRRGRVGLVPPLASSSSSSTVPPPPAAARLACCRGGRGRDPAMSPDALAAAEATEAGLRAGSKRGSLSDIFESSFSIPFLVFFEMFFFSSFSFHLFSLSLFSLVLSPPLPTPPLHSTKQAKQDWTGQKQNKFKPGSCRRSGRLRPSPKTPCRSATRPAS